MVFASRWSHWLGIPVALPALSLFLAILVALVFADRRIPRAVRETSWNVVWALTLIAGGSAGWFLGLQWLWLQTFCPYCIAVHITALAMAALVVTYRTPTPPRRWRLGSIAVAGWLLLVAGQLTVTPPVNYRWMSVEELGRGEPPVLGTSDESLEFATLGGLIEVRTKRFPRLGSPNAEQHLLLLFDYTCSHCRALQKHLLQALSQHPRRSQLVLVPVALWPACNPYVDVRDGSHLSACELARLSLAVWQICPESFPEFNRWLVSQPAAPSATEALRYASTLCNSDELERRYLSEDVKRDLQQAVQVYGFLEGGLLPKLLFPEGVLMGDVPAYEQLEAILEERL